jgi:hypothetical protein
VAEHGQPAAVASYCQYLAQHPELADAARRELAGKTLACWRQTGSRSSVKAGQAQNGEQR